MDKVTVIVPAWNEGKVIGRVLKPLKEWEKEGSGRHVLVADDGSADNTAEIARKAGAEVISVVHQGKGGAVIAGVKHAASKHKADIVVMLDADVLQLKQSHVNLLVKHLKEKDYNMVIAPQKEQSRERLTEELSGQRAIKMKALKPLLIGNRNWLKLMQGFGLEVALNHFIKKVAIARVVIRSDPPYRKGTRTQENEQEAVRKIITERMKRAQLLRAFRKKFGPRKIKIRGTGRRKSMHRK